MRKKKIVTTFNDQQSNQYKNKGNPGRFFPVKSTQNSRTGFSKRSQDGKVKVFGDDENSSLNSNSSINLKNDYEKRVLALTASSELIIGEFNSSDDNLHYLGPAKKFIDLKLSFFSAAYVNPYNFKKLSAVASPFIIPNLALHPTNDTLYFSFFRTDTFAGGILRKFPNGNFQQVLSSDEFPGKYFMGMTAISAVDTSVYAVFQDQFSYLYTYKSTTGNTGSFTQVDNTFGIQQYGFGNAAQHALVVSPFDGTVYVGASIGIPTQPSLRRSIGGTSSYADVDTAGGSSDVTQAIAVSALTGAVYWGTLGTWSVRKSANGNSGTFSVVDGLPSGKVYSITVSPIDGAVYIAGTDAFQTQTEIRRSTTGNSGTFSSVATFGGVTFPVVTVSAMDNSVYVFATNGSFSSVLFYSKTGLSGTFVQVPSSIDPGIGYDILISNKNGKMYFASSDVYVTNTVYNSGTQVSITGATRTYVGEKS